MKRIDVQNQPKLSAGRIFQIAVTGVKYRLFRAVVTVAVIIVAMAFLMNILTESLVKRSVAESVREQIETLHRVDRWIAKLSVPQSAEAIVQRMATEEWPSPYLREIVDMSDLSALAVQEYQPAMREALDYLQFFNDLDYGRLRVLVGPVEGPLIFERLSEDRHWHQFTASLADMRTVRFPTSLDAFQTFIEQWNELEEVIETVRAGQARAIESVQSELDGRAVVDALRQADAAFGDVIRQAGFNLPAAEAQALSGEVRQLELMQHVESTINNHGVRQSVAALHDLLPGDVTMIMIWRMLRNTERAEWYLDVMQENGLDTEGLTPERLAEMANDRAHTRLLTIAEQQTREAGGGLMGIGARMTWLAFVSMLVCAVGIANAMLMSVTERFREIATLKCLGALDAFIMSVFLIEAALLGLVGGVGGALVGLFLAGSRMAITFKGLFWQAIPLQDIFNAGLLSVGVGIVLAAISAVYPSFRAARLAPMEAMRIE